jgi:NSS family neurotransmitter:Na+ symporter
VTWLVENKNLTRIKASIILGLITWALGLLTVFSFNIGQQWTLFGKTMFDLLDYLTANLMLPIGGLFIAIFSGWIMSSTSTQQELAIKSPFFYHTWRFLIRYITPIAILIIFMKVIGVI